MRGLHPDAQDSARPEGLHRAAVRRSAGQSDRLSAAVLPEAGTGKFETCYIWNRVLLRSSLVVGDVSCITELCPGCCRRSIWAVS